jgi:asparagine synthetase B (glutamine-hydrolysing)
MSGVIGMLDPGGADASELRSAAVAASYRGTPTIRSIGHLLLGVLTRDEEEPAIVETPVSLVVADARVDAALPGPNVPTLAETSSGIALLASTLDEAGPDGLDRLAADFALARWDRRRDRLLLARDAFGLRPLYWAKRGRRIGFASDPVVLFELGLASGDLDRDVVAQRLAGSDPAGERTFFAGVRRVLGGRWLTVERGGLMHTGRWFRPETIQVEETSLEEAASAVKEAIVAAVASRARRRPVAISLSGGRDSAAVAAASRAAGIRAVCLTTKAEPDSDPPESDRARELAEALGHEWRPVNVTRPTLQDLEAIPNLAGCPVGFPAFPITLAMRAAVTDARAKVFMQGEGGDPLFAAHPVAVLDLARSGKLRAAASAARAFRHRWIYSYPVIAKCALRAMAPGPLLDARERARPRPPWIWPVGMPRDPMGVPRSSREWLTRFLLYLGTSDYLEMSTQLWQRVGVEYACPLYDQRVVRAALRLPVDLRVPSPYPKPVLGALLAEHAKSRVKADHGPYMKALADRLRGDFPWLFDSSSLSARGGFVRAGALEASGDKLGSSNGLLDLVTLEVWLRRLEVCREATDASGV